MPRVALWHRGENDSWPEASEPEMDLHHVKMMDYPPRSWKSSWRNLKEKGDIMVIILVGLTPSSYTPLKFNSSPLNKGGWKTNVWVSVTFQGRTVKLRGGILTTARSPPKNQFRKGQVVFQSLFFEGLRFFLGGCGVDIKKITHERLNAILRTINFWYLR